MSACSILSCLLPSNLWLQCNEKPKKTAHFAFSTSIQSFLSMQCWQHQYHYRNSKVESLAVFENHWPSSSSLKKADLKCVAKCLRKIIGDSKVVDSNNVKSAMYHLAINFSDKLHNSRFSQPTITRNNTLNIDETGRPKIDKSNGYCTWILHIYFALKTPLTALFCT